MGGETNIKAVSSSSAVYGGRESEKGRQNGSTSHLARGTRPPTHVLGNMLCITLFIRRLSETASLRGHLSVMVHPRDQYQQEIKVKTLQGSNGGWNGSSLKPTGQALRGEVLPLRPELKLLSTDRIASSKKWQLCF